MEGYVLQRNTYLESINNKYQFIDGQLDIISNYYNKKKEGDKKYGTDFKITFIDAMIKFHGDKIKKSRDSISDLEKLIDELDKNIFESDEDDDED